MKLIERYSILLHIIGWLLFFSVPFWAMPESNLFPKPPNTFFIVPMMINNVFLVVFFYINHIYLVPYVLFKKHATVYLFGVILGFCILIILNIMINRYVMIKPQMPMPFLPNNGMPAPPKSLLFPRMFGPTLSYILVILLGILLVLVQERIRSKEEKQQIEIEKTTAELAILKLQVSPHFLFNTLNNIRWLARQKSDKTEDAIVKLSTLLRYILYQANENKVPLMQEIKNLEDYISLQKMRLTERTKVSLNWTGEVQNYQIEPLIFIPFVENAFKYGVHNSENTEINISIRVSERILYFSVENSVFESNIPSNEDSGIGIQNVKKRLEMLYPDSSELKINQDSRKFCVSMKIVLGGGRL